MRGTKGFRLTSGAALNPVEIAPAGSKVGVVARHERAGKRSELTV